MKGPLVVRGGVGGAQNIPLMSLVIRHWGHTEAKQGPLLHYQTKPRSDPEGGGHTHRDKHKDKDKHKLRQTLENDLLWELRRYLVLSALV